MPEARVSGGYSISEAFMCTGARWRTQSLWRSVSPHVGSVGKLLPASPRQQVTRGFAKDGGLLAYQSKEIDLYRQSASYVDKILKGAKPADLPVQRPNEVRADRQYENCEGDRPDFVGSISRPRRRGDRIAGLAGSGRSQSIAMTPRHCDKPSARWPLRTQ